MNEPETQLVDSPKSTERHVVILVHGIRDFALWQDVIRGALEEEGFKVEATNYGRVNLLEFLVPIWFFRKRAIHAIWSQIRIVKQNNPNADISVIAHSFGTFVISHLMREAFEIKFHRVIFCGSVVKYGFPFEQLQNRFTPPIVNEVGTRDVWPAIAQNVTTGYGSAGTYGFRRPLVRDRWHNEARHGYFLDQHFCKKFWVPFLKTGQIVPGAKAPESPRMWLQLLPVFKVIVVVGLLGLAGLFVLEGLSHRPLRERVAEAVRPQTELVSGPVTLQPRDVHTIPLQLSRQGYVEVFTQSLSPEPNGVHVTICSAIHLERNCPSAQMGALQTISAELPAGPGRVSIFNFESNPPMRMIIRVKYPG